MAFEDVILPENGTPAVLAGKNMSNPSSLIY